MYITPGSENNTPNSDHNRNYDAMNSTGSSGSSNMKSVSNGVTTQAAPTAAAPTATTAAGGAQVGGSSDNIFGLGSAGPGPANDSSLFGNMGLSLLQSSVVADMGYTPETSLSNSSRAVNSKDGCKNSKERKRSADDSKNSKSQHREEERNGVGCGHINHHNHSHNPHNSLNGLSQNTQQNGHGQGTPNVNHIRQVNEVVPRVWVISNFLIPVTQQIAIEALKKGDILVLGCSPGGVTEQEVLRKAESLRQRYPGRCLVVELDIRNQALCSSTVAQAIHHFGRIDILVNATSRAYVGALEEVEEWHFRNQMDITFYGAVNMIQAVLPLMRKQFYGHIINIADVNGNIGTPALSLMAAAMHALEGYSEALAFEVAPFNIKVTIVESPMEVNLFTTPMVFAPSLPQYGPDTTVGKVRRVLGEANVFPTQAFKHTVHTVVSIGGLDNPPGRIIVGKDAIHQIKDKLAMLSDDLEEFQNVSYSADFAKYDLGL